MTRGTAECEICGAVHDKGTWGYVFVMIGFPLFIMACAGYILHTGQGPEWLAWIVFGYGAGILSSMGLDPHI